MKVNVLGTDYEIKLCKREEDKRLKANPDISGYCDFSSKKIVILNVLADAKEDPDVMDDLEFVQMNILSHELVHSFAFESGMDTSSPFRDELIIDFFALQLNKIYSAYTEAKAQVSQELKSSIINNIISKTKKREKKN